MFNDAFKEVTGLLDRRFLLNVFFPCLIFCGLLIVVGIVGAGGDLIKLVEAWSKQDLGVQILQIVSFLSLITVFSGIVDSQLPTIIRFYEGYPPLNCYLAKIGREFHQSHFNQLLEAVGANYGYLSSHYPSHHHPEQAILTIMPTRFGNILKNSERYPSDRYGLDAVVIWSRLYHLFPDRFIQVIAEAKSSVDFMLVVSTLSSIFALITGVYLLIVKAPGCLFLLCFWGGLAVAWLAYQGALASAVIYSQQIKTGFDLYRQELFKQMRLKLPPNLKTEKEQWKEVYKFLYQNFPISSEYTDSDKEKSSDTKKNENLPDV
jgi:hypothetical protein